jgi:hypothetical protein
MAAAAAVQGVVDIAATVRATVERTLSSAVDAIVSSSVNVVDMVVDRVGQITQRYSGQESEADAEAAEKEGKKGGGNNEGLPGLVIKMRFFDYANRLRLNDPAGYRRLLDAAKAVANMSDPMQKDAFLLRFFREAPITSFPPRT